MNLLLDCPRVAIFNDTFVKIVKIYYLAFKGPIDKFFIWSKNIQVFLKL